MNISRLSLSLRSGSDNQGTIENRLPREKYEKFHNLCIRNIGSGLPVGPTSRNLHLGLCEGWKAQVFERGCWHSGDSSSSTGEPVRGLRAMMKKLIIHLLFRTVNGCRLLASALAIIWLTANVLPGNLFQNILLCEATQNGKELVFCAKSWVAGRWATLRPSWAVTLSKLEANGRFCGCYNSSRKYQLLYGIITQI